MAGANTPLAVGTPGEPVAGYDARARAMGGAALGLFDGSNVNGLNPAVPASYGRAVFNLTVLRGYNSYITAQGKSVEVTVDVPGAELTVPVTPSLAVTLAFRELFNQNYEVTTPLEYEGEVVGTSRHRGEGAVYGFSVGAAKSFGSRWYAGVEAGYDFGAPREVYRKEFDVKGYSDIEENFEASYKGAKGVIGAGYKVNEKLSCGAIATLYTRHRVRERFYTEYAELGTSDHNFSFPWGAGLGAAYVFGPRARLAADVRYAAWSKFRVDGAARGYRDTLEFRGGAEGRLSTSRKSFFLWRMPYRVGAFYVPWYTREHGAVAKMGFAVGAGYLFLNNEESRLDLTLEYSRRGRFGTNGVEEEMVDFYMSIVGLETWLGKREKED